jgi:endonuclease/exonuclease/phosphatase family metal-dependent hydrolase
MVTSLSAQNSEAMPFFNIKTHRAAVYLVLTILLLCLPAAANRTADASDHFSFDELRELYDNDVLPLPLAEKLRFLLTTPFVDNSRKSHGVVPLSRHGKIGEFLRVVHWNIERGLEFDAIKAAFRSEDEFAGILDVERFPLDSSERAEILEQAAMLRAADVIVFNEVDWGLKRTGYRNVAADLARDLGMNYAFGVQFVELAPIHISRKAKPTNAPEGELGEIISVDPELYKGMHGIAILSRFPLENVRLVPFKHQPYDWFASEKKGPGLIEKGKRQIANTVFLQETMREVRRGGRTSLIADIADERFPSGRVTIAATHFENRTKPENRLIQLTELLNEIKDISHPVILAGDLNTTTADLTPTSLRREFMKRFGSVSFWVKSGVNYALGLGMLHDLTMSGLTFGRKQADPTVRHIPIFAPNAERKLFTKFKEFRFADGGAFDFRGDRERSIGEKSKELSNSNQRGKKGFVTTYQVKRPLMFIGKYKLDWIFVKPANLNDPKDRDQSYKFAPHFGQTLTSINEAVEDRISDHRPMLVDLPLGEPVL